MFCGKIDVVRPGELVIENDTGFEKPLIEVTEIIEGTEPLGEKTKSSGLAEREKSGVPPGVTVIVQVAVLIRLSDMARI